MGASRPWRVPERRAILVPAVAPCCCPPPGKAGPVVLHRSAGRARAVLFLLTVLVLAVLPRPVAQAGVDWSGPARPVYSPAQPGSYAYAPSAVSDAGRTYLFSCHSSAPGEIRDSIWSVRTDVPGQGRMVLAPSATGWDSHHVCDPSVVAGAFQHAGTTYRYAMFYLGTDRDNTDNRIGVAFAHSLDGQWVKYPRPLVDIPAGGAATWGVGQPSATTVDAAAGEVLLFYTDGSAGTAAYRRQLVLGNMAEPVVGPARAVTTAGLGGDVLHNFDVAYDGRRDRFFMAREAGPRPTEQPTYISSQVEIDSISGADLWSGTGAWRVESEITPETTGFPRNHNPGLLRTVHGGLPAGGTIDVVSTRSVTGEFPGTLFSYDLWLLTGVLSGDTADPPSPGRAR